MQEKFRVAKGGSILVNCTNGVCFPVPELVEFVPDEPLIIQGRKFDAVIPKKNMEELLRDGRVTRISAEVPQGEFVATPPGTDQNPFPVPGPGKDDEVTPGREVINTTGRIDAAPIIPALEVKGPEGTAPITSKPKAATAENTKTSIWDCDPAALPNDLETLNIMIMDRDQDAAMPDNVDTAKAVLSKDFVPKAE